MVIAIFFGILISYLVIGFIASRHTKGADEFYVTGRRSGIILVLGGFAGTWISALGTLGYPGMSYSQGIGLVAIWGALPGFLLAAFLIVPQLYRSGSWTLFDFFESRWQDKRLAAVGVCVMFFGMFPYFVAQIMGAATLLSTLTGLSYQTMLYIVCATFFLLTIVGGAWSVTVTDTAMLLVKLSLVAFILPAALAFFGGINKVTVDMYASSPQRFSLTGSLPPLYVLSSCLIWFFGMFAAPHQASRIMIAKDTRTAVAGAILALTLGTVIVWALHFMASGLWVITHDVKPSSSALPYLFAHLPSTAIGALGISALFAAALSSATGMLLTLSMGVGRDVVKRFFKSDLPDKKLLSITRWAVLGFTLAVLATCLAQPEAIVKFAELGGSIFACTFFAPLFFGANWRRVTKNAVFWSMILGGGIDIILWIGWRFMGMPLLFGIQPVLYGITASILTLVIITLKSDPTPAEIKEFERITTRMEVATVAVGANQSNAVIKTRRIDGYDWTCILSIVIGLTLAIGGTVILPP